MPSNGVVFIENLISRNGLILGKISDVSKLHNISSSPIDTEVFLTYSNS